jgi:hypothetical protein
MSEEKIELSPTSLHRVKALLEKPEDALVKEMFECIEEKEHTDIEDRIHRYKQAIRFFKSKLRSLLADNDPNMEQTATISSQSF